MRPVIPYVIAALLFGLGTYGVLRRRNAVLVLMSLELMLGAVNLILVTASVAPLRVAGAGDDLPGVPGPTGQVFALFVIVIAAAEVGVGLAIVLQLYRLRGGIALDEVPLDADPQPVTPPDGVPPKAGPAALPAGALAEPVEPVQPAMPATPVEPAQPAQPATPVQAAKPAEPVQPAKPAEPVQPAMPVGERVAT